MSGAPGLSVQDAIARAKEIAARITAGKAAPAGGESPTGDSSSSIANAPWNKRPHSDDGSDTPPAKQSRPADPSDKAALAASIAARLTSKLGGASSGPAVTPFPSGGQFAASAVRSESIALPDRHVGYLIGRGGETIQRIVRESGCKVQIAQEQTGPERTCALNGNDQQLEHAKRMIRDVLEKARETEQSKALAAELSQHGGGAGGGGGGGGGSGGRGPGHYPEGGPPRGGGGQRDRDRPYGTALDSGDDDPPDYVTDQQLVPTTRVALIIGRGGDTIRRLQEKHCVKMELAHKPTEEDEQGIASHVLKIRGLPHDVETCGKIVKGVVGGTLHTNQIFRVPSSSEAGGYFPEPHLEMGGGKPHDVQTRQFHVPVDKAGIVIGRGGESIKEICRISGAHCEISKERDPNARSKPFSITGTTQQIDMAIRLISQKAGMSASPSEGEYPPYPPHGGGGYPGYPPSSAPGYPPQPGWGGGGGYPPHGGPGWPPQQPGGPDPSGYGNYYANWYGQQQPQQQPWNASQQQPGMPPPPHANGSQDQPPGMGPDGHSDKPPGAGPAPANGADAPAPGVNPATGQADYTEAWIEYYRRSGMHDYANWIQQCVKQGGAPPQPGAAGDKPNEPAPPPPPGGDQGQPPAPAPASAHAPPAGHGGPSSAADYAAYYAQYYASYGYGGYPGAPEKK